jgi:hypothetical protein
MTISQVDKLHIEAHACEKLGVEYWLQQLKEEIFELEDMQAQILALRSQVLESVRSSSTSAAGLNTTDIPPSVMQCDPLTPVHKITVTNRPIATWSDIGPGFTNCLATRGANEDSCIPCNGISTIYSYRCMFPSLPLPLVMERVTNIVALVSVQHGRFPEICNIPILLHCLCYHFLAYYPPGAQS